MGVDIGGLWQQPLQMPDRCLGATLWAHLSGRLLGPLMPHDQRRRRPHGRRRRASTWAARHGWLPHGRHAQLSDWSGGACAAVANMGGPEPLHSRAQRRTSTPPIRRRGRALQPAGREHEMERARRASALRVRVEAGSSGGGGAAAAGGASSGSAAPAAAARAGRRLGGHTRGARRGARRGTPRASRHVGPAAAAGGKALDRLARRTAAQPEQATPRRGGGARPRRPRRRPRRGGRRRQGGGASATAPRLTPDASAAARLIMDTAGAVTLLGALLDSSHWRPTALRLCLNLCLTTGADAAATAARSGGGGCVGSRVSYG